MVNISVTYGSPMTSLFLPTVSKNSKKCYKNSTTLALKSGSATKVMYNEFGEDVEQPTTIDSNEIEEVDLYIYLGQCITMERTRDQTCYDPRMARFR